MTRIFLILVAVLFGLFAALYTFAPTGVVESVGIQASPSGLTDIRATYGGFQLGFCLFVIWALGDASRYSVALLATGLTIGCVGLVRLFGVLIDGSPETFHYIAFVFEIILPAVSFWLYRQETANA